MEFIKYSREKVVGGKHQQWHNDNEINCSLYTGLTIYTAAVGQCPRYAKS